VPFSKLRLSIVIQQAPDEHLCDAALMACQAAIVSDPVLLRLSFTAGASGFLNLTSRATGPTGSGTPHPLQYNSLQAQLAGVLEHNGTLRVLQVLVSHILAG